jgi:hypothetical protein
VTSAPVAYAPQLNGVRAMKLGLLDRDYLRRALRVYPGVECHVVRLDGIDRMRSRDLLALSKKLGADAAAMILAVRNHDTERQAYSHKFPAFEDVLEFDVTIELFGKRITRKIRASYQHTPEWEYFDLLKEAPFTGWPSSGLQLTYKADPERDGLVADGSSWEEVDLLSIGEVWNVIDDTIEERCKVEDAKRRRAAERNNGARRPIR